MRQSAWFRFMLSVLVVWGCAGALSQAQPQSSFPVGVDPRVELLTIAFRLADAEEFNQESSTSAYSRAVDQHFTAYREHAAIAATRTVREERSIGFDAVVSFAVHLTDVETCEFRVPLEPWPATFDNRWNAESARDFARHLRQFVADTKFTEFLRAQEPFTRETAGRLRALLEQKPYRAWIENFFGETLSSGSIAIPGMLTGGGNYGASVRHPDGRLDVCPVIGVWQWDEKGGAIFNEKNVATVVHEFCHPFVNPIVDQNAEALMTAGDALFESHPMVFKSQAYGSPRTVLYESFVRASVAHLMRTHLDGPAADNALGAEVQRGFWLTPALVDALASYERQRDKYPTLRAFMPVMIEVIGKPQELIADARERLPRAILLSPTVDGEDVDPVVEFRIEFDRAMDPESRGLSFEGDVPFERVVPSKFDDAGRVYTVTLRLPAGRKITAWLNQRGSGLASAEGYALAPISFSFTTKPEAAPPSQ